MIAGRCRLLRIFWWFNNAGGAGQSTKGDCPRHCKPAERRRTGQSTEGVCPAVLQTNVVVSPFFHLGRRGAGMVPTPLAARRSYSVREAFARELSRAVTMVEHGSLLRKCGLTGRHSGVSLPLRGACARRAGLQSLSGRGRREHVARDL